MTQVSISPGIANGTVQQSETSRAGWSCHATSCDRPIRRSGRVPRDDSLPYHTNMNTRSCIVIIAAAAELTANASALAAQMWSPPKEVQAAYSAGTRSESGSPGAGYWQIWPRYILTARLEPETAMLHGSGRIQIMNTSPTGQLRK